MKYLITGGCGFIGSNLANAVMEKGEELVVVDNLYRTGSEQNLAWLKSKGQYKFIHADIRATNDVEKVVKDVRPDVIFHLAGQVAMTTSLQNPRLDFEINVIGGNNILEAIRKYSPYSIVTYSSSNKVYGDLEYISYDETNTRYIAKGYERGFDENVCLDLRSPYGCSKGATDQYMLDYHRMFNIRSIVFRHSSVFGTRQFSTYDQGWVGWFVKQALLVKTNKMKDTFDISGTGKQVRDLLFIDDLIQCYFKAVKEIDKTQGQPFNIGGGYQNSLSLLELFKVLEEKLGIKMSYKQLPVRASDQKVFIADVTKAKKYFDWEPKIDKQTGVYAVIDWMKTL